MSLYFGVKTFVNRTLLVSKIVLSGERERVLDLIDISKPADLDWILLKFISGETDPDLLGLKEDKGPFRFKLDASVLNEGD